MVVMMASINSGMSLFVVNLIDELSSGCLTPSLECGRNSFGIISTFAAACWWIFAFGGN